MIYDLSQPLFNDEPQWPQFHPTFAAFPVLIQNAGGAWTRAVARDEGEMG
jgi:kynurenine formamidase